jgi:hypothetical protein
VLVFGDVGRHDDPEEKRQDEIRAEINAGHRFNSFATEREGNFVKWCVQASIAGSELRGLSCAIQAHRRT